MADQKERKGFKSKVARGVRTTLRQIDSRTGKDAWKRANTLKKLFDYFAGDRDRFDAWLQDVVDGMGYSTGNMVTSNRMLKALKTIPVQTIWFKFGWSDGVSKLASIPSSQERSVCVSMIAKALGPEGKKKFSKKAFNEVLSAHAPSREIKKGWSKSQDEVDAKQLRYQLDQVRKWAKQVVKGEFKGLVKLMNAEVQAILEIEPAKKARAKK